MRVRAVLLSLVLIATAFLSRSRAADSPALPPGVPPRLSPEESRKTFQLAPGLDVRLVASEPVVEQPLSLTFDDRGRLWVLEYLQYPIPNGLKAVEVDQYLRTKYDRVPEPPPRGPKGADRIVILENPDARGRFQRAREFLTGLDLASGFALGYEGVFVVQPPYLLFYADKDHDDRPDGDPEILLKGFGMEDAHAFANSLTWGPDGWLYGAQGSTVTARIRGIEFQQGIWRYHPPTKRFELFAEGGGNTWGIDFDRNGQLFAGGNTTEPLCHHVQGAYYIKGFGKHGPLHNPYAFGYFNPVRHYGFLGSALTGGFVLYQGGLFPERFRDAVIYPNLRVNAMRVSRLQPEGSTFTTHFQEDFITSTDRWFRPVKSLVGPDGALYVADWYDYNISHTDPKDRSQWYMPSRDTGRIWRVAPTGVEPRADARQPLASRTSDQLVELLNHPNAWYSREARRILMERRDPSVRSRLAAAVRHETKDAKAALEALWALYVSGEFDDALALELLDHPIDHVRAWTVRLVGDAGRAAPALAERFVALARSEPSPVVRSQLACTCKRLPGDQALPVVEVLLGRAEDLADPHIPLLLWWAIEDKAVSDRARVLRLLDTPEGWNRPLTHAAVIERLPRRYLGEGTPEGYATCAALLALAPSAEERERVVRALEQQMEGLHLDRPPAPLLAELGPSLKADPSPALVRLSLRLGIAPAEALGASRAADPKLPAAERIAMIRTLGEIGRPESLPVLMARFRPEEPLAVQAEAIAALQRYKSPAVAAALLAHYAKLPAGLRDKARDVLVSRPAWSAELLAAVESGSVPAKEVGTEQVRRILLHKDAGLNARAEKLWGQVRPATSREIQGRIQAASIILARGKGNAAAGKPLAEKLCLTCHTLFGAGAKVGPDLTAVDRKNLDVLIQNVVDPSGIIREGYQQYLVATRDGRVLSGLLAENNAEKLVVLDAKGERTALRADEVEEVTRADASLMPERILEPLSDQEVCDLFAYLRSEPAKP